MDTFTEELVVRKNTHKDIAKLAAYLLGIFSVPAIFILLGVTVNGYFIIVAICAAFFAVYGSYYLVTGLYREFEYAVTNSNLTIDKVIAKRSRKRVISVDIKRFNTLRKFADSDFDKKDYRKIFKASITPDGEDVYGAEMHLDKFGGECLLLFSPSEKTLEALKPYLKNTIKAEMFKNNIKKPTSAKSKPAHSKETAKTKTTESDSKPAAKAEAAKKTPDGKDTKSDSKTADKADTAQKFPDGKDTKSDSKTADKADIAQKFPDGKTNKSGGKKTSKKAKNTKNNR